MNDNWYKLDNAGKIFPTIYGKNDPNSFRLSALFYQEVQVEFLDEALLLALKRFPTFNVRLKRGVFWYYFEGNNSTPIIKEESSHMFTSIHPTRLNGYMFTLSHCDRRLTIEIFHALSDGTGGIEFFKCICYYYLTLTGVSINNDGSIKTNEIEKLITESADSFNSNYNSKQPKARKEEKAFQLEGEFYPDMFIGMIQAIIDVDDLKEVCKKYDATITQYVGGVILYSIYKIYYEGRDVKKPAKLFIPVNARKYFSSQSLRNFVLYVRSKADYTGEVSVEKMIKCIKNTIEEDLNVDNLKSIIRDNVEKEKLVLVRFTPLFIKKLVLRIGYHFIGANTSTVSFSNLGVVKTPIEMKDYIERFEFAISVSKGMPMNLGGISFNNKLVLSFASKLKNRDLIRTIISTMALELDNIVVETNDLEVE